MLGFDAMRRFVALASRVSDRENVYSRLPSSLKFYVNCGLQNIFNQKSATRQKK